MMRLGYGLLYPHFVIAWCGAAWLPVLTHSGSTSQGIIFPVLGLVVFWGLYCAVYWWWGCGRHVGWLPPLWVFFGVAWDGSHDCSQWVSHLPLVLPSGCFCYAASFEASLIVCLFCFLGALSLLGHTAFPTYHHLTLAYCMLLSGGYLLGVYHGCFGVYCMQLPPLLGWGFCCDGNLPSSQLCWGMGTHWLTDIHTYIHTSIHTYIHTYIYTDRHTYIHTYRHTYIHTYMHT